MKRLVFILALVATFGVSAVAQCPTIFVTGPKIQTAIGDSMTFTIKVEGIDSSKIKFEWSVDVGTISGGQGTPSIIVATNEDIAGTSPMATVKISGLPPNCPNEAYGIGEVKIKNSIKSVARVIKKRKQSWREDKIKLDGFAKQVELNNWVGIFIRIDIKQKNYFQKLKSKETKIKKYLFEKHQIAKSRIWVVYSENVVESRNGDYHSYILFVSIPKLYPEKKPQPKQK